MYDLQQIKAKLFDVVKERLSLIDDIESQWDEHHFDVVEWIKTESSTDEASFKENENLILQYVNGDDKYREAIDDFCIAVCGWKFSSLLMQMMSLNENDIINMIKHEKQY